MSEAQFKVHLLILWRFIRRNWYVYFGNQANKLKKTLNKNISNVLNSKNKVPGITTQDQIKDEVGKLLSGNNSHPASPTLTTISGICDGNWEDCTNDTEVTGMKEYVNENLQDLEKKGIDTQPLKDLFNQALTLLPDNLVNKNSN